jgi:glycosyltransferase involved in cell wall biosynthesis
MQARGHRPAAEIWQLIDSSGIGGAERHIATLGRCLEGRGGDVRVVLMADHGKNPWLAQLAAAGLEWRIIEGGARGLWQALRKERPALVHCHGYKAGVVGRPLARLAGVPVVTTFHSGARGHFPLAAYEILDEWTSFLGPRIAVGRRIQARLPFSSVVVPSFIEAGQRPSVRELPNRVGFVGRLSEEKRPDHFCEIARRFGDRVEWHVYGDGPMRAELEGRYGDLVRFHGVATDMGQVWPTLGALLMPSRFEGLPLAALEALAHGVPVIASRVGDLPSVVVQDRTGWLFEAGDVAAATALVSRWYALGEQARCDMRQWCWEHVEEHFAVERHLPRILECYRAAGLRAATRLALGNEA